MLYRNLLAMETEEVLRSQPIDGAVLLGACDKTTPALIMGATSARLPFIFVPGGPMLRGNWRGRDARQRLGCVEVLGGKARGQNQRGRVVRNRGRHRPLARPLHDDGHGGHDDGDRGDARPDAAGRVVHSCEWTCLTGAWRRSRAGRSWRMRGRDQRPAEFLTAESFTTRSWPTWRSAVRRMRSCISSRWQDARAWQAAAGDVSTRSRVARRAWPIFGPRENS
jgi:hypothetical protein